jgi:hypothetical protein
VSRDRTGLRRSDRGLSANGGWRTDACDPCTAAHPRTTVRCVRAASWATTITTTRRRARAHVAFTPTRSAPSGAVLLHQGFRRRGRDPAGLPQSKAARGPSGCGASERASCSPSSAGEPGLRAWASLGPLDSTAGRPRARRSSSARHLVRGDGVSRRGRGPATSCWCERRPLPLDRSARTHRLFPSLGGTSTI